MSWVLLALATLAACEVLSRIDLAGQLQSLSETASRAVRVISNPAISDHWKERILPRYALRIAWAAITSFVLLLVALSPFALLVVVAPLWGADFAAFLVGWSAILACTGLGLGYMLLRRRLHMVAPNSAYSPMERLLHRLALASAARGETLFDLEKATAPSAPKAIDEGRHVFVVGLARAGTTVLLRAIHDSGEFASLTYRDMPFVLAPNLWARFRGDRKTVEGLSERAHGDGILVSVDSPEALEEPFWRSFCGSEYLRCDRLVPHQPDASTIADYRRFVSHVCARYGRARYLAKNNNSILRLPALCAAFPEGIILTPFRHPHRHAASLLRQHERFCADPEPFTQEYMGLLAHHEFGPTHRPFVMNAKPAGTSNDVNYWLAMWIDVHRDLLARAEENVRQILPIAHEDLCDESSGIWQALAKRLDVPPAPSGFSLRHSEVPAADASSLAEAELLYQRLHDLSQQRLLR
ncbi:MAG: sulfotransferase [Pseudomonadota bacterium]